MNNPPSRSSLIPPFYAKAESVVRHLLETYGDERFRGFLALLRQGQRVDAALMETYGFNQDGLDERWLNAQMEPRESEDERALPDGVRFVLLMGLLIMVGALVSGIIIAWNSPSNSARSPH
jgi:hypothetical protein